MRHTFRAGADVSWQFRSVRARQARRGAAIGRIDDWRLFTPEALISGNVYPDFATRSDDAAAGRRIGADAYTEAARRPISAISALICSLLAFEPV